MSCRVQLAWFLVLFYLAAFVESAEQPFAAPDVAKGELEFKAVLAEIADYGDCWSNALSKFDRDCDNLGEEVHSRLALSFTSCFLTKMGQRPLNCAESEPLSSCKALAQFLEGPLGTTYSKFFTHAQVICKCLRSRHWEAETVRATSDLGAFSVLTIAQLQHSTKMQERLLQQQRLMQERGDHLQQELGSVYSILQKHGRQLDACVIRLFNVETFIADQFSALRSISYYIMAAVVSLLMTTSKRTADARPWLLVLFLANLGVDRLLFKWTYLDAADSRAPLEEDSPVCERITLCRRLVCAVALVVYLYKFYTYRNLAAGTNELLASPRTEARALHPLHTVQSPSVGLAYLFTGRGRSSFLDQDSGSGPSEDSSSDTLHPTDYYSEAGDS